jgi:hypothetical protein
MCSGVYLAGDQLMGGLRISHGTGRPVLLACIMPLLLLPALLLPGRMAAAPDKIWHSATLQLTLSYPQTWKIVPERHAALLLRSASGRAEFEIFPLVAGAAGNSLRAAANQALVTTKCDTAVKISSTNVGSLGVLGMVATGLCTGSDLGWRLSVTTFHYAGNTMLLRAWLFHTDAAGGHDLSSIQASLAKTM